MDLNERLSASSASLNFDRFHLSAAPGCDATNGARTTGDVQSANGAQFMLDPAKMVGVYARSKSVAAGLDDCAAKLVDLDK